MFNIFSKRNCLVLVNFVNYNHLYVMSRDIIVSIVFSTKVSITIGFPPKHPVLNLEY